MGLCRSHHEGFRGSQEPLDPRVLIRWPRWSLQHYILTTHSCDLASPWLPYPRGRDPLQYQEDPRKEDKGRFSLRACHRQGAPRCRLPFTAASAGTPFGRAAASPPWGGTSPSSSTAPPHHPYFNILANMMCGTIYYFPMIYCIYVYVWVVIVLGNCEIFCWLVAYKFFIFYDGLMYWYMSAHICWGCIRLSPLHVVRRRDRRSWTETVFQVLYACYINSWLINREYIGDLIT
jgi:hypothetical protein